MPGVDLRIGTTAPGLDVATRLGPGRAPDLYADFERGDWRYAGSHHGTAADWLATAGGSGAGWTLTFGPVVVGEERLTNGGFDSGIAGWSAAPGWPASLSHVGGRLRNSYGSGGQTRLQTTASVTPGRAYRLSGTVTASSSGSLQLASSPAGAGVYGPNIGSLPTPATGESLFAVDSSSWAVGANSNPGAAGFDEWDDFSLKEIRPFGGWALEGFSLYVRAVAPATVAGTQVLFQADAGGSERDRVRLAWGSDRRMRLIVTRNNSEQANVDLGTVETGTGFEVRASLAADEVCGALDGAPARLDASAALPGTGVVRLGRSFTGEAWGGSVRAFGLWFGSQPLAIDPALALAVRGDSTAAGDGGSTKWFTSLANGYSPARAVHNTAVSGQGIATMRDRILADPRRRDWPTILYDRRNTGETAQGYLAALEGAVGALTGRVLILPQVPAADGAEAPDVLAVMAEIDAGVRDRWPGSSFSAAETAAFLASLSPGATRSDGVHRNNTGQAIEAAAIRAWMDARGW